MDEKKVVRSARLLTPLEAMTVHALEVGQTEDEPWDVLADAVEELPLKGLARKIRELSEPLPPYGKNIRPVHQTYYVAYRAEIQLNERKQLAEKLAEWLGLDREVYWGFPSSCGETFDLESLPDRGIMLRGTRRWVRSEKAYFVYLATSKGDEAWFKELDANVNTLP